MDRDVKQHQGSGFLLSIKKKLFQSRCQNCVQWHNLVSHSYLPGSFVSLVGVVKRFLCLTLPSSTPLPFNGFCLLDCFSSSALLDQVGFDFFFFSLIATLRVLSWMITSLCNLLKLSGKYIVLFWWVVFVILLRITGTPGKTVFAFLLKILKGLLMSSIGTSSQVKVNLHQMCFTSPGKAWWYVEAEMVQRGTSFF